MRNLEPPERSGPDYPTRATRVQFWGSIGIMRFVCGIAIAVLFGVFPLYAQFSGRVTGAVVDATGAAVPGADVELFVAGGKRAVLAVKTSADGSYHLIGVRPADYDL